MRAAEAGTEAWDKRRQLCCSGDSRGHARGSERVQVTDGRSTAPTPAHTAALCFPRSVFCPGSDDAAYRPSGEDPDAEGRRRGRQRTRGLDGITDAMDMSLSRLREMARDREVRRAAVHAVMKGWARLIDWTITPESSSGRSQPLKSHDRDSTVPTSRRPVTADGGRAEGGAMVGNALRAATGAWLCVCVCVSTPTHMHRQRRPRALLDSCCREAIPGNQNLTFPVSGPTFSVTC